MGFKHRLLLSGAALSVAFGATAARAQEEASLLDEVVVTAEKREESIQDVPVAITAFTAERRELIGIETVTDMTNFTPGLNYSVGTDRITLRGIGRLTNNLASEGGVANYVDGVYSSSSVSAGGSPLMIDRVEVLRGPQGTLYGRNSIGGAINTISKRPTNEFYAEVRATFANYDRQYYEGVISGPITQGLRYRLSVGRLNQDEGWFTNYAGGPDEGEIRDSWYYEGQLEADLGENVEAWVKVAFSQYNNRASPGGRSGGSFAQPDPSLFGPGSLSPSTGFGYLSGANLVAIGPIRGNTVLQTGDLRGFSTNIPGENDQESESIVGEIIWRLPGMDLKYLAGYSHYDYELTTDFDASAIVSYQVPLNPTGLCALLGPARCQPFTVFPNVVSQYVEDKEWWSHEVNLTSTTEGPLQWIVGAYYYHEKYRQPVTLTEPDQPQLAAPLGAAPNPLRIIYHTNQAMEAESKAVFGQIDWSFAPTWRATVGLRYTQDEKAGVESTRQMCLGLPSCLASIAGLFGVSPANATIANLGSLTPALDITNSVASGLPPAGVTAPQNGVVGPAVTNPATGIRSRALAGEWDAWTGTAGLEWKPEEETLVYGRYSRGYKAGGFNSGTITAFPETKPEFVDAYELGVKRDWSRSFQTNISAFYYDYTDAQVLVTYQPEIGPRYSTYFNLPKSTIQGIEIESTWAPLDNLRILANYAYLDAQIDEACCIVDSDDPTAMLPGARPAGPLGPIDAATGQPTRGQDLAGQTLPASPKHKVAVNALYTWDLAPGSLTGSISWLWRDEVYSSMFNRELNLAPSRSQIDARLTFTDAEDRYTLVAYVQNLTDEEDIDSIGASRNSLGVIQPGAYSLVPPRTYGVQIQYRF
ncbi:TonB-dependent receptor [Phenylobacterium terrae]|uniref:TonB-dependent receptor n=1 Tax=Phenylobacterium terrae TaxID=2665495 RepID=A0ABW4N100_9CAUL